MDSYKKSLTPREKSIYKSIFQMMHREQIKDIVVAERKHFEKLLGETLRVGERQAKVLSMIAQSYIDKLEKNTVQKREQRQYFKYITKMLEDLLADRD